jgi:hypothetical protein
MKELFANLFWVYKELRFSTPFFIKNIAYFLYIFYCIWYNNCNYAIKF